MWIFKSESTYRSQRIWMEKSKNENLAIDNAYEKWQPYLTLDGEKGDSSFTLRSAMETPVPITSNQWYKKIDENKNQPIYKKSKVI